MRYLPNSATGALPSQGLRDVDRRAIVRRVKAAAEVARQLGAARVAQVPVTSQSSTGNQVLTRDDLSPARRKVAT